MNAAAIVFSESNQVRIWRLSQSWFQYPNREDVLGEGLAHPIRYLVDDRSPLRENGKLRVVRGVLLLVETKEHSSNNALACIIGGCR